MAKGKYEYWRTKEGLIKIEGWAKDGLTEKQIAKNMGIGYSTLQAWKVQYQEIVDTLKRGKEVVDREVENALFKNAIGYETKEVIRERSPENGQMVVVKEIIRQVPPNTTAQIFWLKNRKRGEWSDRQSVEITKPPEDDSLKEMEAYFEQKEEGSTGSAVE